MALAGRSIVTGVHRFAVDRRRAGKPVSKRLSLSLRDPELETGSKAGRSGFGPGYEDRTSTDIGSNTGSNTGSTTGSISAVTEAAIAAWILVFALLLHFFSLFLLLSLIPSIALRYSTLLPLSISLSLSLCSPSAPLFLSLRIAFVLLFPPFSLFFPIFFPFFLSLSLSLFFLLLFFLVLLLFARKLVHIRIGGRSSAARSLIKSHKNREAVSSPASYGNREVEPVLNIDSGSSLYTECIRRESLLMLNEF